MRVRSFVSDIEASRKRGEEGEEQGGGGRRTAEGGCGTGRVIFRTGFAGAIDMIYIYTRYNIYIYYIYIYQVYIHFS